MVFSSSWWVVYRKLFPQVVWNRHKKFCWRQWGSSLQCLYMLDPLLILPLTPAEFFSRSWLERAIFLKNLFDNFFCHSRKKKRTHNVPWRRYLCIMVHKSFCIFIASFFVKYSPIVHCPLSYIHCSLFIVQYPILNLNCPIFNIKCQIFNVQCLLFIVHCPLRTFLTH